MRRFAIALLLITLFSMNLLCQELSPSDKQIVESARLSYYNLERLGFLSATCKVNFDFSTIPSIPVEDREASYRLLHTMRFTLMLEGKNPTVYYSYPAGADEITKQRIAPLANLLKSLASGLFQTWTSKGLDGPIPAFDTMVQSVATANDGYVMTLKVPGGPIRVEMNKNYLVNRIVSIGGKIDEQPHYSPTADGLIFTGNNVIDDSEQGGRVTVQYEIENAIVEGFWLPSSVHLRVNQNINVKFSLSDCSVDKGTVIVVKPSEVSDHQ
jgi:hypothetical protein